MFMAILTLLTEPSILAVAIYYSTRLGGHSAGAASAHYGYGIPLEVEKLVTAPIGLERKVAPEPLKHTSINCSCGIDVYYIYGYFCFFTQHTLSKSIRHNWYRKTSNY